MTEENDPAFAVDELVARIKAGAALRRGEPDPRDAASDVSAIEELLYVAEARCAERSRLPAHPLFALLRLPLVRSLTLRALAYASSDQRRINLALISALRATLASNRNLDERLRKLESPEAE